VVGEATDGRPAADPARRARADAVLTDIRMPGMDGLEATRRICVRKRAGDAGQPRGAMTSLGAIMSLPAAEAGRLPGQAATRAGCGRR
jgi:CheY-like chemotaxis protein